MQNKLLPCPFCGGEVSIALCGDDEYSWWTVTRGKNKAEDKNCHCRVFMESKSFYEEIDGDGETEKEHLIKKWNTRKPMERIVEQLESIKVIRCKDCDLLQSCKNAQYLGLEGYCSNAEKVV